MRGADADACAVVEAEVEAVAGVEAATADVRLMAGLGATTEAGVLLVRWLRRCGWLT